MLTEKQFQRLSHLLDELHICTALKFALMNEDGNEVYSSNYCSPLCRLILGTEQGAERCFECDRRAVEKVRNTKYRQRYLCHAGLYEIAMPVIENGQITATIVCGQMLDDSPIELQWERVRKRCEWYDDADALYQAFLQLKRIPARQMQACMEVVNACVSDVKLQALKTSGVKDDRAALESYIETHYTQQIRIEDLCRALNLSRTRLFQICEKHFQTSPMQLIRSRRMTVARELLLSTDEPVGVIAESVGIPDINRFSKLFSSYYKLSPTRLRKQEKSKSML